jgi:hypothetical protein
MIKKAIPLLSFSLLLVFMLKAETDTTFSSIVLVRNSNSTYSLEATANGSISADDIKNLENWSIMDENNNKVEVTSVSKNLDEIVYVNIQYKNQKKLTVAFKNGEGFLVDCSSLALNPVIPTPTFDISQSTNNQTIVKYDINVPFNTKNYQYNYYLDIGSELKGNITYPDSQEANYSLYLLGYKYIGKNLKRLYKESAQINMGGNIKGTLDTPFDKSTLDSSAEVILEIPYTDYPFLELHKIYGYTRQAVPLTITAKADIETDFSAISGYLYSKVLYEMGFLPILNIQPYVDCKCLLPSGDLTINAIIRVAATISSIGLTTISSSPNSNFIFVETGYTWNNDEQVSIPVSFGYSLSF